MGRGLAQLAAGAAFFFFFFERGSSRAVPFYYYIFFFLSLCFPSLKKIYFFSGRAGSGGWDAAWRWGGGGGGLAATAPRPAPRPDRRKGKGKTPGGESKNMEGRARPHGSGRCCLPRAAGCGIWERGWGGERPQRGAGGEWGGMEGKGGPTNGCSQPSQGCGEEEKGSGASAGGFLGGPKPAGASPVWQGWGLVQRSPPGWQRGVGLQGGFKG